MHTPHLTPLDSPLAIATETIKRIWHISVTWHHQHCFFFTKKQSQKETFSRKSRVKTPLNTPLRAGFRQ